MNNKQLKEHMKKNHVHMWEVAEKLNIHETNFSKLFRHELDEKRKKEILLAIEQIILDRIGDDQQ